MICNCVFESTQAGKSKGIMSVLVFKLLRPLIGLFEYCAQSVSLMLFWALMGQNEDKIKINATANITLILNCRYCLLPL